MLSTTLEPAATALVDEVLSTTPAVRRRLDLRSEVDPSLVSEALGVAACAPSAGAEQPLRWVVVTDSGVRRRVGEAYRTAYTEFDAQRPGTTDESVRRVRESSASLADVMADVPVLVLACSAAPAPEAPTGPEAAKFYASVYPAVWSFQLALRTRGLGSCLTTIWLRRAAEIATAVGLAPGITPCALLPVAHISGSDTLGRVRRRPVEEYVRWI